jgi:hypothetical protein
MRYVSDMTTERPNTVSGLVEKHREIAGQIEHTRRQLNRLVADLEAVEHTIRLFDPDAPLGRAKPVPAKDAAFKGEMRRDVMAALRAAQGPLTSLDIARQAMAVRQLPDDAKAVIVIRKRLGRASTSSSGWAGWRRSPWRGSTKGGG